MPTNVTPVDPARSIGGLMRLANILLPKIIAAARFDAKAYCTGTAGLFNKAQLQRPADWVTYAQDTINRCTAHDRL